MIYTRGSSGLGRSIGNETGLRDRLRSLGAIAHICCDFKEVTFTEQLGYAAHADVILGLHGAGLINNIYAPPGSLTVELKTVYGYGLTLFAVSTEARGGTFIELNIKDYHIWGQPGLSRNKPIDEPLTDRIVSGLVQALARREQLRSQAASRMIKPAADELMLLRAAASRQSLFEPLRTPAARIGDVVIHPCSMDAFLKSLVASTDQQPMSKLSEPEQLDYMLHILGPAVSAAPSQCAMLPVMSSQI